MGGGGDHGTTTSASTLRQRGGGGTATTTKSLATTTKDNSTSDSNDLMINNTSKTTVLGKLFSSKEERTFVIPHLHKILGFSCLASFLYRFAYIGERDGNFGPHWGTLVFILHHWTLNASSFLFHVPKKRIAGSTDGGFRIWAEYRGHALVFASRHLAFMLLLWVEQTTGQRYWFLDVPMVLATCASADLVSYWQGKENQSNTVRDGTCTDPFENWFASESQMWLTAFCLVGYKSYAIHLVGLAVIQFNAFLMTLRRKRVAQAVLLMRAYGVTLLAAFFSIANYDSFSTSSARRGLIAVSFGSLACILRMGPLHLNKYVLWTLLGLGWHAIETYGPAYYHHNNTVWMAAHVTTKFVTSWLGWRKRARAPPEARSDDFLYAFVICHLGLFGFAAVRVYVAEYHNLPF